MIYIYPRKGVKVLEHKHLIIDDDLYFTINAENGKIEYTSKKIIAKGSHNSERITFKLPHYIEGHDMMLCNSVILSYTNIDSTTGESYSGPYEITDMELIDENTITCSWLISDNASKYSGSTSFAIDFRCIDENDYVVYSWPTQRCNGLKIANTINAKETPFERQPDILEQFKSEILEEVSDMDLGSVKTVNNIKPDENGNINIVEPDTNWNQNDEFAKDYIKNRPFYDTSVIILDNYSYTEDIEVVNMSGKVSDSVIPNFKDVIESKKYSYDLYTNGEFANYELETEEYGELTPTVQAFMVTLNDEGNKATAAIFNIIEDDAEMGLSKGVWILPAGGDYHFKNFKIEGEIKQIDPKYIKDMYYEETSLQHFDITDKFTFTPQASDGITMQIGEGTSTLPFVFTIGETYKFTINGTEYETICQDMTDIIGEGCLGFGDIDAMLNNDIASVNFIAYGSYNPDIPNEFYMPAVIIKTESEITEFAIDGVALNIVKIDKKYLPNSIESINGITPGSDGAVVLTNSDVGAAKVIEVTETDGKLSMTSDEIEEEEAAGNIVKIIDSKGKVYTRAGEKFINMSYNPDLFNIIITYASVNWTLVSYKEYTLPNIPAYPGDKNVGKILTAYDNGYILTKPYEREIFIISIKDGVWKSGKTMEEIENSLLLNKDLHATITSDFLDITSVSGSEIGCIDLKYTSEEIPNIDYDATAYIFSGVYGDYLITATIKEDGVTVDVVNTKKLITSDEANALIDEKLAAIGVAEGGEF